MGLFNNSELDEPQFGVDVSSGGDVNLPQLPRVPMPEIVERRETRIEPGQPFQRSKSIMERMRDLTTSLMTPSEEGNYTTSPLYNIGRVIGAFGAGMQGKGGEFLAREGGLQERISAGLAQRKLAQEHLDLAKQTQERQNLLADIQISREARSLKKEDREDRARAAVKEAILNPPKTTMGEDDPEALKRAILPHVMELTTNFNELKQFFNNDRISPAQLGALFPDIPPNEAKLLAQMPPDQLHKFIDTKTRAEMEQRRVGHEERRAKLEAERLELERRRVGVLEAGLAQREEKPAASGTYVTPTGEVQYPKTAVEAKQFTRLEHGSPAEKVFTSNNILHTHIDQALQHIEGIAGGDRNRFIQTLGSKLSTLKNDPDAIALYKFLAAATPVATSSAYAAQSGAGMRGGFRLAQMLKETGIEPGDTLRTALASKLKPLAEITLQNARDMNLPIQKYEVQLNRINSLLAGRLGTTGAGAPGPGAVLQRNSTTGETRWKMPDGTFKPVK